MKYLIVLGLLLLPVMSHAEEDISIIDGIPRFSDTYSPTSYEVNLSTTLVISIDGEIVVKFDNYSEWLSCQTRPGLKRKIRKIRQIIDSLSDFPASETRELRERAGWLRSYYNSLP